MRSGVDLHYQLVGLLLQAGRAGIPLAALARELYPYQRGRDARDRVVRLMYASGSVPIWQTNVNGRVIVGLLAHEYAAMLAGLGIPLDPARLADDDGC